MGQQDARLLAMDGYSEIGAIYFSIGDKTSVARYLKPAQQTASNIEQLVVETYIGNPPYSYIQGRMPKVLRQYHAAEHQVYNAYLSKVRHLPKRASLSELRQFVPTLQEAKNTKSHSLFCGSTICVSTAIMLFGAATPNLLKLQNTNLIFMSTWLAASVVLAYLISKWIQQKYYLAKPNEKQLELGLAALKEVLNGN